MKAARLWWLLLAVGCDDDAYLREAPDMAMLVHEDLGFSTGDAASNASVDVIDNMFAPRNVTITQGGTVTWTWRGSNPHTVTADDGSFDSSPAKSSGTFSHIFVGTGSFPYHCTVHSASEGTITVQ
jgi:plastocyanin